MEYLVIDIDERLVTAARFDISGRSAALHGAVSFTLDGETGLADAAAQIAAGISGSPRVILCLPAAMFAQRSVTLPLTDLRKVREILPAQLQGEIALPAEEAVFDVLPAAGGSYLALWARRSEVAAAVDLFRAAGCEPQVVSSTPFGWQFLPGIHSDCAVCDGTALAVFSAGRPVCIRALDGTDLKRQLQATRAALELAGTPLPSRLMMFGERTETAAAPEGLAVEPLLLPDGEASIFRTEKAFQQLAGLYAAACSCHAGVLPDFRRGDLAWTSGDIRLRRKLFLTTALVVAAIVLLFVSKGLQYRAARSDVASLNASIASIYREVFPSRSKAVDELSEIKGEIRKLTGSGSSVSVLDVLRQLAEAKGATVNGLFEAELEGNALRLKGDARSAQAVNEFRTALSGIATIGDAGEIKSRPDGTVSFSLAGTLKEGAK